MAHPELVPDVGVVQGQVDDDQVGEQQFLEHVAADVAGAPLLVGAEHLEAGTLQGRLEILGVDRVEVDVLLAAVRHGHEHVQSHLASPECLPIRGQRAAHSRQSPARGWPQRAVVRIATAYAL